MPTITTETRKRGVFGWIVAVLFWGWNLLMLAATISGLNSVAPDYARGGAHAGSTAYAAGATIGFGLILLLWLLGSLVLGLMMLFTRGKRVTISREV